MNLLSVEGVGKTFQDKAIFKNISFGINQGQKIALIAKNGSGKTTLLKVIAGEITPDQGEVNQRKELRFLAQEPSLNPQLTVEECIPQSENEILQVIQRYEMAFCILKRKRNTRLPLKPWTNIKPGILKPNTSKFYLNSN